MAEQKDSSTSAAQGMFDEIAAFASDTDAHCFCSHGELVGGEPDIEEISRELNHLRSVICRIGWMAYHASSSIFNGSVMRGGAEEWLLSPVTRSAIQASRAKV